MVRTVILSFLLFFSLASAKELVVKNCGETHIENQYGFAVYSCSATSMPRPTSMPRIDELKHPKQPKEKEYAKRH